MTASAPIKTKLAALDSLAGIVAVDQQVVPCQGAAGLLQPASTLEWAQIKGSKTNVPYQVADQFVRIRVVTGHQQHASGRANCRSLNEVTHQHRVECLDDARAGGQAGDDFAVCLRAQFIENQTRRNLQERIGCRLLRSCSTPRSRILTTFTRIAHSEILYKKQYVLIKYFFSDV